jgi:hypothetical protein
MKWRHKRKVLFMSMFHDSIMQTQPVSGTEVSKPESITQYNTAMGGIDLRDKVVKPYILETK